MAAMVRHDSTREGTHTDAWKASHESHHDHDDAHNKGKQAGRDSIAKSLGLKTSKRLDQWEVGIINQSCRMSFPCWSPFRAFRCVCDECMDVVFNSREPDFTNHADEDGHTPLMGAAQEGDHAYIQRLLDQGADTEMRTLFGKTAADFAHDKGRGDCIPLLRLRQDTIKEQARLDRKARNNGKDYELEDFDMNDMGMDANFADDKHDHANKLLGPGVHVEEGGF